MHQTQNKGSRNRASFPVNDVQPIVQLECKSARLPYYYYYYYFLSKIARLVHFTLTGRFLTFDVRRRRLDAWRPAPVLIPRYF